MHQYLVLTSFKRPPCSIAEIPKVVMRTYGIIVFFPEDNVNMVYKTVPPMVPVKVSEKGPPILS